MLGLQVGCQRVGIPYLSGSPWAVALPTLQRRLLHTSCSRCCWTMTADTGSFLPPWRTFALGCGGVTPLTPTSRDPLIIVLTTLITVSRTCSTMHAARCRLRGGIRQGLKRAGGKCSGAAQYAQVGGEADGQAVQMADLESSSLRVQGHEREGTGWDEEAQALVRHRQATSSVHNRTVSETRGSLCSGLLAGKLAWGFHEKNVLCCRQLG